ncbi:STAS domain-containing protein [Lentzea tibetensis]|uniref:STAS domain-containing protein n=1 Tax=Lentzea tibetensis TaxID=2591470 RepID=A0A563F1U9_9PSEU|nr:STAS domain-containing protein [Lentzea tibetensis]
MPKISFRVMPASRESISHVQTGAARKPDLCAICVRSTSGTSENGRRRVVRRIVPGRPVQFTEPVDLELSAGGPGVVIAEVRGVLDERSARRFEETVLAGLDQDPVLMVVDLREVPEVDVSGVAAIVRVTRQAGARDVDVFVTGGSALLGFTGVCGFF